ncbi:hypothetical protein RhiirC2_788312 [Rhizophagus irregularis]|uniref:F-box domain-containing protein n=1 Tax=Rhizophagus irregularis TaxID=588596 RepID=A0A2N1MQE1_9GLOM|nr:hypothetical protein RhiirC2_788312 [Rhizophagus irregularis]
MACSKVFSENLRELTDEIIQYFRYDYSTLYSCILVNRLWCRLAIPLLWEDPFSVPTQNYQVIEILLVNLNEKDKAHLIEHGIIKNLFYSNTLFNYPNFIKCLSTHNIRISIDNFATSGKSEIYKSLFKTFIENEVNLYSFELVLDISMDYEYFNYTLELILQNPFIIHNIRNLVIHIYRSDRMNNIIPFLEFLSSNCNSISSIHFLLATKIPLIEKYLSNIIALQQNLRTISFGYNDPFYNSMLSFSNFSNTLNTIIFYHIDFKNIKLLNQLINQLNVLESIHIIYCSSLDSNFIHQIINIVKPIKLKSLFLSEIIQIELLRLLLQKSGNYLENFELGFMADEVTELKQQLLELILNYCTNVRYLNIVIFDKINIHPIFNLIDNNLKNINYIIIEFNFIESYDSGKVCSIILQNLGQILPSKLEYLRLDLNFNINDLEIFLKESQNTFIRKLSIRKTAMKKITSFIRRLSISKTTMEKKGVDSILSCIKKYIMKNKRVEYLAINVIFQNNDRIEIEDLYSLKYEVDEFKLHDIIVRKYDDLYIQAFDFVNNDKICKSYDY